jgi:hypothetical protein
MELTAASFVGSKRREECERMWASRVGPEATATLWKSQARANLGIVYMLFFMLLVTLFRVIDMPILMALSSLLCIPAAYNLFLRVRLFRSAKRQGGAYLALPQSSWPLVPLRDPDLFDRWYAARGQPRWPNRIQS